MIRSLGWLVLVLLLGGCAGQNRPLQLVTGSSPVYPPAAKAAGIEGLVVVRYDVAKDGRVVNARIDSAEPIGIFEEAALATVRSWRYNPALKDGSPVQVENVVSNIRFELDSQKRYDRY